MDKRMTYGGNGSHWDGCAEVHWDCKIAQLEAELAALREQVRWRKYPEEKPEEKGWYQTLEKNSIGLFEDTSYWMGHSWQVTEIDGEILFWMPPLPPPPEESENE